MARQSNLSLSNIRYFAQNLSEPRDFEQHLDNILKVRVPGTIGIQQVRQVSRQNWNGDVKPRTSWLSN